MLSTSSAPLDGAASSPLANTNADLANTNQYMHSNFVAKDADRLLQEMIDQETSRYLSKDQLFDLAKERGAQMPLWISSSLFRYALGVIAVDKSNELTLLKAQEEEYTLLHRARKASGDHVHVGVWRTLRCDLVVNRQLTSRFGHTNDANRRRIENVIDAIEISFPEVSLQMAKTILKYISPMAAVNTERESDVYFCLKYFIEILRGEGQILHSSGSLLSIVSNFLCHFHSFIPTLYKHFFENDVDALDWVPDLLTSLFVDHLPQHQLLVLWGYYLMDGFHYHPFVLLAILEEGLDDLLELDGEGILTFLRSRPFPLRYRAGGGNSAALGATNDSPYRCGADSKALFARAKSMFHVANRKDKLV